MNSNLTNYLPKDGLRICNANGYCVEARGENARIIADSIAFLIICVALFYLFKIK